MKHLKLFFALFAMLALGVGNAWGAEQTVKWTATSGALGNGIGSGTIKTGTYAWNYTRTLISGASYTGWSSSCIQLGKNGGVENITFTTSAIPGTIKSVAVECSSYNNAHKVSIAVGGTTYLAATATAKWTTIGTKTGTGSSTGTINISFTGGTRALYIKSITVVYEETSGSTEPALTSIAISGDLTNKTYEEGEELDLEDLTVTAKYDDNSEEDVTNDVEWSYEPLTAGQTSVTVTATYEGLTATKTINDLTVTEHVVTPGEYCITPNNTFWGTSYNGSDANAATTLSGTQNDISILHTKSGSNLYVNNTQTRVYTNHAMQISVPSGYVITSIAFTADGNNWAGTHTANVGKMTDSKNWAGFANEVTITFGGTCRITKICVNYIKDTKYVLTITEPAAGTGTLVVKDGENALTSGAEIYEGTKLTVTATPETGYEDGVVVVKNASDEDVTATVYADGVLTMPAYAVTISATFEEKPCELLAKPTVSATTTYSSAKLTWEAIANAAKYSVKVGTADAVETTETSYKATDLEAETIYTYQVKAIAADDQSEYCDSEAAEGSFTTSAAPVVTLTLKDIAGTTTKTGALNSTITLPDEAATCTKTFVGWDADEDCDHSPTYAPGAEYTLAAEPQTLYAVYADENNAATEEVYTFSAFTSTDEVTITDPESFDIKLLKNSGSTKPAFNSSKEEARLYAKGSLVISAVTPISKIVYTYVENKGGSNNVVPTIDGVKGTTDTGNWDSSQKTWTGNDTEVTFSTSGSAGNIGFKQVAVTVGATSYSNYSTTCAAAPKADVTPTEVTATAAGVNGTLEVSYENVNTANVSVALFNDEACTKAFTADWLTASLDGDKKITYTVAATTLYTERKAYIQLTAPETTGATEPAVVVIPVTQAAKDKVFASLEALLAAITPTTEGVEVTVTLTNEIIQDFYTSGSYRNGIALNVPYQGGVKVIEIYCKDVPAEWVKGGKVSGTITCPWKLYNSTWELCPTAWTELTYTAPATVKSIAVSGTPTKTTYVDGEAFDPTGLVVTATLTDDSTEPIDVALVDWTFNPETLSKGETSVSVVATYNTMASAAYEVTGLTVNDIPTKTVAEFIAAGGTRCYLEGIVSGLTEGNSMKYGNFDLTDASGTIYVYGCLNASGEKEKFAELGVKNDDKIKVIADKLTVYNSKDQAKDVQYVSHISAATITIADITMEVGHEKAIEATITPDAAKPTVQYAITSGNEYITLDGTTITAVAAGEATITATVAEGATYLGNSVDFTVTVKAPEQALTEWVLTSLADITINDLVVITMTKGETTWAMTNNNGTSAAPAAPVVTLSADALAAEPAENLKWVVSNDNGTLTIYPYGTYETWLYCTNTNNGVKVGTGEAKEFTINGNYLYTSQTTDARYLGVYDGANWRCYTSINSNIEDQTLAFYVKKNANDVLPGTGEEPGDDPVVPIPTINPTATFIFNTADGLTNLGITYPATEDEGNADSYKTEFENNATFTQDGITMTTTGGTTVATRVWLTAAGKLDLRVYKGATLTFSVPAEHKISAIVFDGSNINHLLVDGIAVNNNTWTGSKQEITFTAKEDASTIKINTIAFVVEYTRDVTNTNTYGTICLPYASASTSGAYFYEVVGQGTENGKPAVYLASVNTLKAGVPYIFEKTANTIKVVYSSEKEDTPQNANGLIGTFEETTVPDGDYILYYDAFRTNEPAGSLNKIRAYRAYLDMDNVTGGAPQQMPGRRYIGMDVQGENGTTGLDNIMTTDAPVKTIENGQLIIIRNGEKYNVQGVRL